MLKEKLKQIKNYQPRLYIVLIVLAVVFFTTIKVNALLLVNRVSGYIVLDVENHGEAWYINPDDSIRYYLGLPSDAFSVMREFGIGISNQDLNQIPIGILYSGSVDGDNDGLSDNLEKAIGTDLNKADTDDDGYTDKEELEAGYNPNGIEKLVYDENLAERVAGRILLQVESNGEAWYVSPETKKRYYLARPKDSFFIMRSLGLGITSSDLSQINANVNLNINNNIYTSVKMAGALPENYSECSQRSGENIISQLSCWWIPKNRADINKCKDIADSWNGPEAECALIYYNPDFEFPENIEQCLAINDQKTNKSECNIMILKNGSYDDQAYNKLVLKCPGVYSSEGVCFQMFRKQSNSFTHLPQDYNDCSEIGGLVYPTDVVDGQMSNYACRVMFNKIDYPTLYQECVDQNGEQSDKVAGSQGLGEGCSIEFKG